MATSPEHMDEPAQAPAPKAGKPPITANPAFPWIVALWFAALLGVGSLIVPVALLERASTASGLAALLPMAAPPLGFTAQSLVALAGTLVGGMLGFVLAKKIAAPRNDKGSERKVLNAPEDIGDFGIEGDDHDDLPAPAGRRRALAIEQEEGPSDFLNVAPVPAVRTPKEGPAMDDGVDEESPDQEPVAEAEDQPAAEESRQEFEASEEPRQVFQPDPVEPEVEDEPFELDAAAALEAEADAGLTEEQPAHAQDLPQPGFERQEFMAVASATGPVVDVHYAEPVEAAATAEEPLAFSPPSMAQEDHDEDDNEDHGDEQLFAAEPTYAPHDNAGPESEETVSDKQIFEPTGEPAAASPELPVDETAVEEVAVDAAAIDDADQAVAPGDEDGEGLVQLVQRLGSTLDKHREWAAEKAAEKAMMAKAEAEAAARAEAEAAAIAEAEAIAAAEAEAAEAAAEEDPALDAPVPDEFDPAAAEEAAQAMAAYFGAPAAQPAVEDQADAETEAEETVEAPAFDKPADTGEEPRQRYGAFTGTIAAVDLGDEDEDEDEDAEIADLAASFTLPPMQVSEPEPEPAPRPAFDQPPAAVEDEAEAEDEAEDSADMADFAAANPFKRNAEEFVRIEEPEPDADNAEPAVLFPNQENRKAPADAARAFDPPAGEAEATPQRPERPQPSNDDNERALREALLNLQRMGK